MKIRGKQSIKLFLKSAQECMEREKFILLDQILQNICIYHISRYKEDQEIMIFNNNHYTMVTQTLQNELSQLQNSFLKFKLIVNQSQINENGFQQQIKRQMEKIREIIERFCTKMESEITNMKNKLFSDFSQSNQIPHFHSIDFHQRYNSFYQKIRSIQQKLKQTQKNESKLIEAISILMRKYQIPQQPTMIQNDQNLQKKLRISQITLAANEKHCGFGGNRSLESSTSSRQKLNRTLKKNQTNIYLFNNKDHSQQKNHFYDSKQFLRTFSKPSPNSKISLKQISNPTVPSRQPYQTMVKQADRSNNRASSLDRHQHRLHFMMNKLHE